MRADNSAHLVASARQRHELTRAKAIRAIRELDTAGTPVTFESVARTADVSRSWLYTQPDVRTEIERLRTLNHWPLPAPAAPARQRGSDASLARRLDIALARNRELATDNQRLRRQLAHALGQLRTAGPAVTENPPTHDTLR